MTGVAAAPTWPGADVAEAYRVVLGELADAPTGVEAIPVAVRLPERGPAADPVGTGVALLVDLPAELGPHGWKLADRPGRDLAAARDLARADLDALAIAALGYDGPLAVPVTGPLTLAARLYLARGDLALADDGAVRELTASLAAGIADHLRALAVAVPGARPRVLLAEPMLAAVLAGAVPTFSGHRMIRALPAGPAAELLRTVVDAVRGAGADVVVHLGESRVGVPTAVAAGADAVALAVAGLDERGWEVVAEAVEGGTRLWAALPDAHRSSCAGADVAGQADAVATPWRRVGLTVPALADVVVTPGRGSSPGRTTAPDEARRALADAVRAAERLAELAAG